ncbi:MAG: TonB-dependent receptor plug domain-containing protein, partial [Gammaproteobacteria bacterium]|nr:TonB-dependent receptor plug domain-containing protein [Gammaproteobacteria bacterium]
MRASKRMPAYLGIAAASLGLGTQSALAEGVSQAIEEIIVTARAREESLQVIPFSIQAITSEMIANRDLRRLEELVQITPGLLYEPVATGLSGNPVIRGQANTATTARIQNTAVFLNGVYLQRQSMINPGLLEMERIEVLKGPQSAAFARNAFSGAINYITKGPEEEFGASVSYTRGSHDREDLTFSITGPLGSDRVLGRFAYGQSEYDGHTRNTHPMASINTPGPSTRDRVGGWDDTTYNAGLRILISDALTFDADYFRSEQFREADASFWLQGVGAEVLAGAQYNTMNCNDAVLDLGFAGSGSGNTLWCGALPMQNPLLDGLYV